MTERSATRRELESSLRSLLPSQADLQGLTIKQKPATAIAGIGGLLTGYAWGWIRGHRARTRRSR